jgi:hypothetical protein
MKTNYYLFLFFLGFSFVGKAQSSMPNGGFEAWSTINYEDPQYFVQSSNSQTLSKFNTVNVVKTTDAYHGAFAVKLTTISAGVDTNAAYFVNTNNTNGGPNTWHGGVPYTQKPTGIHGYYKSAIPAGDSALMIVTFSLAGNNIGFYYFKLYGTHSVYTPFNFALSPALTINPDSVVFGAVSSDFINNTQIPGSMLQIDSVAFTGVTSQPALLNGDFELWQNYSIDALDNWYADYRNGVSKTTDAHTGNFALELQTTLGDRNGVPWPNVGMAGTGFYPNNCSGICTEQGGYPFTNTVDTLAFWYKYTPSVANDSAEVYGSFKNNGSNIWGVSKRLGSSSIYKYVEMPISVMGGMSPDSVIINFNSSLWQDSTVNYVGADLKIDDVHFKSQPLSTGVIEFGQYDKTFRVYPNPAKEELIIAAEKNSIELTNIKVVDITGRVIKNEALNNVYFLKINTSSYASGIYFYEIKDKQGMIYKNKFVKE